MFVRDNEYVARKIRLYSFSMLLREGSTETHPRLMSTALNILQMENEDVLKFLAAGT